MQSIILNWNICILMKINPKKNFNHWQKSIGNMNIHLVLAGLLRDHLLVHDYPLVAGDWRALVFGAHLK